jgi:hypothetical protein
VRFEQVGDVWVPMECDVHTFLLHPRLGIDLTTKARHRRTEVVLNPDFEALSSFVPDDIRNGAMAWLTNDVNTKYTWRDGELVNRRPMSVVDRR